MFDILEVDLKKILHGDQTFTYGKAICAGDTITLRPRVAEIFDKKGGAMEFIVIETTATNQDGEDVGRTRKTVVVRR